jgi:hypothetical protein
MSFSSAVRALDEEERLKREAAESPARPAFDYGDFGGELQRRFGWLGEEKSFLGVPRRLQVGPVSTHNPLAAPADLVGVLGTTADMISDAAVKPALAPALVAARALATPSAMALRAARDIAQSSSISPIHALGGIPAAGADLLGRDPTLQEVVNPVHAAGYMDEQARRDWVRGLAWGIATDPTNLVPGVGLVGTVGRPLLRGARVASTAIKAGEAVGLGGRVAARAEPFLARAVSVDEAAEQVLGRAYKALGGGIATGGRAVMGELEGGLPTITQNLPGAVARPLGAGAEGLGRGLRAAGTQSDLARRTVGVSNIQSALRAVAQQAGARGVPLDKLLFGPSVAGVVGKTIWDEVARGYTRMFDTASALDEPIKQVAGMDVIRQYQQHRQDIEAAMATQREEIWNRTDPHWVQQSAPEGLGQLLEPDARKMTEENFAQQAALITGLQRDAQQSLERLTALTPEQMALKGDWAIDEAQKTRVTDTFRAAIEDIDTSGRQAAQQARILGGYTEKESGRWVPGIFEDEAEQRAGKDTIYRVNREQAIEKTRSTIASITSEFDDELRSGDIAGLARMAGEQFGAHFANTRAETQPMSAWLDQLAPQHKRTLTDQDSLSLLRESSRALMLDRRYIRRIFEQEVRPKLINIDKVGQDQADAMLDQMLGSKEHVRSNMALYDVRPEIAAKVEQRLAKYEGTGDLMSGDGTMGLVSQEMIRRRMGAGEERLLKPWLGPLLTAAGMWRESALVSVGYHVANLASGLALAYHGGVSPADILTQTTRNLQDYVQSGAAMESLKTGAVYNPALHRNTMPEYLSIRDDLPQAIRRSIGEPTNALPGIVGRTGPQSAFARVPWQARAGVGAGLGVAAAMSADPDDRPLNALAVGALGAATLGGMPRIVGLNRSVANAVEDALHTTVFNARFKEYLPAAKQAFFEQIDERLAAAAIQDTVGRPLSNAARLPGLNDIQSLGDMIAAQREGGLRIDMAGPTTPVVRDPRGWTVNQIERQQFDPLQGPVPAPAGAPPGPRATLTPPPATAATGAAAPAPRDLVAAVDAMNLADYVKESIRNDVVRAQNLDVVDLIEELSAQRLTAVQVANRLKGRATAVPMTNSEWRSVVRSTRSALGIPSMDNATEFTTWLDNYTARQAGTPAAPSTAGAAPPSALLPGGPQGAAVGPRINETADAAGRAPDLGLAASPTTPGFRAEQTVPLNEELKKFWLSRNGNLKPDEIHTFILKKGGTTGQADALSSGWWQDSDDLAIAPAVADNTGINFDYSDVPNITEWLRRSQVMPFVTWTSKALPVYAAILMQHPQYIWAIDQLNDLSEEDIQEAGLTERWAGLARQGMLGSMVADLALGKNGSMLAQPWKLIFPYADLGVREPNEDDTLIDQLMTVLQPLGLTPGPAVTMPLEAVGAISDRPFGLFRPSSYIEAVGGAIEGRPIDFEAPSTALQRASRAALGAEDQESVSGLHPAVEWAIRNRIAEIAFEETGGPAKGQYLVAMDDPTSGIWRRAAAEIARERGVQTAIGSLAPIRPKFLSQTEERIRAREQAQGVAPPQLSAVRERPVTAEERLIAERGLKKAPLRRDETLDDRVRYLRTQALRTVANKADPATEAFRYTSGSEGTSRSRGFKALAEYRKQIKGLPYAEQQRLLGEFFDLRPDLTEAALTSAASRG